MGLVFGIWVRQGSLVHVTGLSLFGGLRLFLARQKSTKEKKIFGSLRRVWKTCPVFFFTTFLFWCFAKHALV
jgi:hypothetical protein